MSQVTQDNSEKLYNHVKQAVTAAAEGAVAGMAVEKFLRGRKQMIVDWSK